MAEFRARTAEELAGTRRAEDRGDGGMDPLASGNPRKQGLNRKMRDMGFDPELLRTVPAVVRDLTTNDLEDLAKKLTGVEVNNPRIDRLTIEDLQGVEALFADARAKVLQHVAVDMGNTRGLASARGVDISCCCCTPCCCCAASDTSPFEE